MSFSSFKSTLLARGDNTSLDTKVLKELKKEDYKSLYAMIVKKQSLNPTKKIELKEAVTKYKKLDEKHKKLFPDPLIELKGNTKGRASSASLEIMAKKMDEISRGTQACADRIMEAAGQKDVARVEELAGKKITYPPSFIP